MSSPQVYAAGVKLETLGPVGDLSIAHEFPASGVGGPVSASFTMLLPAAARPAWIAQGIPAEVRMGYPLLAGKLGEVDWNDGKFTIVGAPREGTDFPAVTTGWVPTSTPDTGIDGAISLGGVSWSRPASISTTPLAEGDETEQLNPLTDLLAAYGDTTADRLYVDAYRRILKAPDPVVPELVILPGAGELSWTTDKQATRVVGRWTDTAGHLHTTTVGSGTPVRMVNMLPRGPLTSAQATNILTNILARSSAGGWADGLVIPAEMIVGTPHLADVGERVGRGVMVRLLGQRDPRPDRLPVGYVDFIPERSEWNVEDRTITLTPRGMVAREFAAVLAEFGVEEAA